MKIHVVVMNVKIIECPDLPPVANGSVVWNATHAQVTCDAGFLLVGVEVLTCSNGVWNGTAPQCELGKNNRVMFS